MKRYVSPNSRLEVLEEVDDLGLDGYVEGGDRLVADDQGRLHRQRPGDADPLALAPRELVRVAAGVLGQEPDAAEEVGARAPPARRPSRTIRWTASGSAMIWPTVIRGFSEL